MEKETTTNLNNLTLYLRVGTRGMHCSCTGSAAVLPSSHSTRSPRTGLLRIRGAVRGAVRGAGARLHQARGRTHTGRHACRNRDAPPGGTHAETRTPNPRTTMRARLKRPFGVAERLQAAGRDGRSRARRSQTDEAPQVLNACQSHHTRCEAKRTAHCRVSLRHPQPS